MAGTIQLTSNRQTRTGFGELVYEWVADASDGSVPTTELPLIDGHLLLLVTDPGSTAPTDDYDVTLVDENGIDQLQSQGEDRDTADTEEVLITYSGTIVNPFLCSFRTYTLTVANNSVNSAEGTIRIVYQLPRRPEWL